MITSVDCSRLIGKFNIFFIAVALIGLEFCQLIFPALSEKVNSLGSVLPPVFNFFSVQCAAVKDSSLVYLLGCGVYYAVSLRLFKVETNLIINTALLLYLALLLLNLGGPFISHYPEYRSVSY